MCVCIQYLATGSSFNRKAYNNNIWYWIRISESYAMMRICIYSFISVDQNSFIWPERKQFSLLYGWMIDAWYVERLYSGVSFFFFFLISSFTNYRSHLVGAFGAFPPNGPNATFYYHIQFQLAVSNLYLSFFISPIINFNNFGTRNILSNKMLLISLIFWSKYVELESTLCQKI